MLGLAPHTVVDDRDKAITMHMAGDTQGHVGPDNRLYVLGTSRVFPAAPPLQGYGNPDRGRPLSGERSCHVSRLLDTSEFLLTDVNCSGSLLVGIGRSRTSMPDSCAPNLS